MCVSPIRIKNPNYGLKDIGYSFLKDCDSAYINIPCGHCLECVRIRQSSWVQRCQIESKFGHPFFCTLTYNDESLPVYDCPDGFKIRYADYKDLRNMIKRLRNNNAFGRPFRFLAVSELGSLKARPHFHCLFFIQKNESDSVYDIMNLENLGYQVVLNEWRRNYGSNRNPDYRPLCTFIRKWQSGQIKSTFDFHYVNTSPDKGTSDDVSFYITKYLFKPSDKLAKLQQALKLNLHPIDYDQVWKIVRPRLFSSLNFGYGAYDYQNKKKGFSRWVFINSLPSFKILRGMVDRSISSGAEFPQFFDLDTGKSLPLSFYYQENPYLFTVIDKSIFLTRLDNSDNIVIPEDRHVSELLQSEYNLLKYRSLLEDKFKFTDYLFD